MVERKSSKLPLQGSGTGAAAGSSRAAVLPSLRSEEEAAEARGRSAGGTVIVGYCDQLSEY